MFIVLEVQAVANPSKIIISGISLNIGLITIRVLWFGTVHKNIDPEQVDMSVRISIGFVIFLFSFNRINGVLFIGAQILLILSRTE
jgi:hypothetical protein